MNLGGQSWEPAGKKLAGCPGIEEAPQRRRNGLVLYLLQDALTLWLVLAMLRSVVVLTRLALLE